jgi:uncharacterized membrane protein
MYVQRRLYLLPCRFDHVLLRQILSSQHVHDKKDRSEGNKVLTGIYDLLQMSAEVCCIALGACRYWEEEVSRNVLYIEPIIMMNLLIF